jgi:hypothetical protein
MDAAIAWINEIRMQQNLRQQPAGSKRRQTSQPAEPPLPPEKVMCPKNIYDDEAFFAGHTRIPRSVEGGHSC